MSWPGGLRRSGISHSQQVPGSSDSSEQTLAAPLRNGARRATSRRRTCFGHVRAAGQDCLADLTGEGAAMRTRAAVAWEAKKPLAIETVDLDGPKAGEALVEVMATGVCHTDAYTLDGLDSEGLFPAVLGHEGAGIVREVGAGVTSVKVGDHVIPLYTPECRQCKTCLSGKTNLCTDRK